MEEAVGFYRDTLGLTQKFQDGSHRAAAASPLPDAC